MGCSHAVTNCSDDKTRGVDVIKTKVVAVCITVKCFSVWFGCNRLINNQTDKPFWQFVLCSSFTTLQKYHFIIHWEKSRSRQELIQQEHRHASLGDKSILELSLGAVLVCQECNFTTWSLYHTHHYYHLLSLFSGQVDQTKQDGFSGDSFLCWLWASCRVLQVWIWRHYMTVWH